MKFKIVKLSRFSGNKSSLYSVIIEGEQETLFDTFIRNNVPDNLHKVEQIFATLNSIGKKVVQTIFFSVRKKKVKRVMVSKQFMIILLQNFDSIVLNMVVLP